MKNEKRIIAEANRRFANGEFENIKTTRIAITITSIMAIISIVFLLVTLLTRS
jgi:6-phosphogluconolactonase/glucosamine-6-phosphate isomerase/deaminase